MMMMMMNQKDKVRRCKQLFLSMTQTQEIYTSRGTFQMSACRVQRVLTMSVACHWQQHYHHCV